MAGYPHPPGFPGVFALSFLALLHAKLLTNIPTPRPPGMRPYSDVMLATNEETGQLRPHHTEPKHHAIYLFNEPSLLCNSYLISR